MSTFLETTIDKVFAALKSTRHYFAQSSVVDILPLRIVAAVCDDSTTTICEEMNGCTSIFDYVVNEYRK